MSTQWDDLAEAEHDSAEWAIQQTDHTIHAAEQQRHRERTEP